MIMLLTAIFGVGECTAGEKGQGTVAGSRAGVFIGKKSEPVWIWYCFGYGTFMSLNWRMEGV